MSRWGDPNDYECRVLVDPENNGWMKVATPEEAERYPVNEIRLKWAIPVSAFAELLKRKTP